MIHRLKALAPIALAGISLLTSPAYSEDVKLPPTMVVTAYDTGTAGFNIAVGVGKMMKDKYGTDVRVLPAGNDVARLAPLRAKRAAMSAMGSGTLFRPGRRVRIRHQGMGSATPATRAVLGRLQRRLRSASPRIRGVTEIKQLKGKRVGFVVGSPALNQNALAILAFGDLKQSDVKIVEFSSYGAMWKGMVNNDVDAAFATTITGPAKELETSPRGIIWPPLPPSDKAGWERVKKVGSFFFPHVATCGAGISKDKPIELGNYPYPIFVSYGSLPADEVYSITKAMITGYDAYKDSAPGAGGLAADRQTKNWVVPVHPGAAKALKEAGQWTDAQEAHNKELLKRQQVLAAAWADYGKSNPPSDDKAFLDGWMKARAAALAKANMPNGFE